MRPGSRSTGAVLSEERRSSAPRLLAARSIGFAVSVRFVVVSVSFSALVVVLHRLLPARVIVLTATPRGGSSHTHAVP